MEQEQRASSKLKHGAQLEASSALRLDLAKDFCRSSFSGVRLDHTQRHSAARYIQASDSVSFPGLTVPRH